VAAETAGAEKPKLAIICTVWYYLTHGQHEGDRFNHGYPMHGKWHDPEVELVSICASSLSLNLLLPEVPGTLRCLRTVLEATLNAHSLDATAHCHGCTDVDQKSKTDTHGTDPNDPDKEYTGDLTWRREQEFEQLTVYDTIAGALRCGGDRLAVDAVLIIGEHGDYETDEYQMTHWPRYEFFSEVVDVFKEDGRALPIFSDKHLSWNWDLAKEMVATS
jgi:hypothetical protein